MNNIIEVDQVEVSRLVASAYRFTIDGRPAVLLEKDASPAVASAAARAATGCEEVSFSHLNKGYPVYVSTMSPDYPYKRTPYVHTGFEAGAL